MLVSGKIVALRQADIFRIVGKAWNWNVNTHFSHFLNFHLENQKSNTGGSWLVRLFWFIELSACISLPSSSKSKTLIFSARRVGFFDFEIGIIPCWMFQRSKTYAGDFEYLSAISRIVLLLKLPRKSGAHAITPIELSRQSESKFSLCNSGVCSIWLIIGLTVQCDKRYSSWLTSKLQTPMLLALPSE